MNERWIWVSLPYATYGIAVLDGKVIDAPPIARWMVGKPERFAADWLKKKGATCIPLDSLRAELAGDLGLGAGDAPAVATGEFCEPAGRGGPTHSEPEAGNDGA